MSLTVEDFREQQTALKCRECGLATLDLEHNLDNNGYRIVCACGSRSPLTGVPVYLPHRNKKTAKRRAYPDGQSLEEVWERFDNRCVCCSATKDQLIFLGFGRHRQHVAEYADHGHDGPIVPMCEPCHAEATRRQKDVKHWLKKLSEVYAPKSDVASSPGVPAARVPSDPMQAA